MLNYRSCPLRDAFNIYGEEREEWDIYITIN